MELYFKEYLVKRYLEMVKEAEAKEKPYYDNILKIDGTILYNISIEDERIRDFEYYCKQYNYIATVRKNTIINGAEHLMIHSSPNYFILTDSNEYENATEKEQKEMDKQITYNLDYNVARKQVLRKEISKMLKKIVDVENKNNSNYDDFGGFDEMYGYYNYKEYSLDKITNYERIFQILDPNNVYSKLEFEFGLLKETQDFITLDVFGDELTFKKDNVKEVFKQKFEFINELDNNKNGIIESYSMCNAIELYKRKYKTNFDKIYINAL
ncbi:hypothetical protein C4097_06640 [Clostridioides difficile]|uniref:hypothetical protein n=1 Tax=Clostridioides sp. ZZV14-6345 TaxID=2811496 RepID=UPI0007BC767B|nr:hypothetical protein [Clostridioides sp. ZZV14-6345]MDB3084238.1 hypothetical protein [Clostridioides difficile]CZR99559.1 hypothetical protein CDFC105_64397 [Clostridioides difficile]CZS03645.1 hypothetical protein CDFC105_71264 [Clostridioides difficile]HBG5350085.1 hypothetical protein [Clostridioides difficile]